MNLIQVRGSRVLVRMFGKQHIGFTWAILTAGIVACSGDPPRGTATFADYDGPPAFPSKRRSLVGSGGERVFVTLDTDAIGVLDVATGSWLGPTPIGHDPVEVDGPRAIQRAPDGRSLYVVLTYLSAHEEDASHDQDGEEHEETGPVEFGFSSRSGYVQRLDTRDLALLGELRVDANPADLLVSEDGEQLTVTHYNLLRARKETVRPDDRRANIVITGTDAIAGTDAPEPTRLSTCAAPRGLAWSKASGKLYAACSGEDALAVIDAQARSVLRVPLEAGDDDQEQPVFEPSEVSANDSGELIAVSTMGERRGVTIFDVATEEFRSERLPMDGAPGKALWRDGNLLIPLRDPDGLLLADSDGKALARHDLEADHCSPIDLAVSGDGQQLFVLCADVGDGSAILTLALEAGGVGEVLMSLPIPSAQRMAVVSP